MCTCVCVCVMKLGHDYHYNVNSPRSLLQTDSVHVNTKDAENVLVSKDDFEHALTYDIKPVRR